MFEEIKNIESEKSDLQKFGISAGIILLIIAGFLFWKEKESFQLPLIIGIIVLASGFAMPIVLKPFYWVWMVFATILGWVMTRVILSLLLYVIITPIGLILRLLGKQFLALKWNKTDGTYWNYRSKSISEQERYDKQF